MDPVSAVGLAASCAGIATRVTSTIKTLHDLRAKYKNTDRTFTYFIVHLSTLRSATSRLAEWVERNAVVRLSIEEQVDLQQSVDTCNALVEIIDATVSRSANGASGVFTFRSKVKFMWNESEISECRDILQLQIQALMFQLQLIQLPTLAERSAARASIAASVIDRARDETSSLLESAERTSIISTGSTRSSMFLFEATLFNSGPYKRTFSRLGKKEYRRPAQPEQLPPVEESSRTDSSFTVRNKGTHASSRIARMAALEGSDDESWERPSGTPIAASTKNTNQDLAGRSLQIPKIASIAPPPPADRDANPGQSEQLPEFKDYYSMESIKAGSYVAVLWAYTPRANDEFDLERGDLIKIVGIWDDGWATGCKLDGTAEDWEKDKEAIRDTSGEIKAFPEDHRRGSPRDLGMASDFGHHIFHHTILPSTVPGAIYWDREDEKAYARVEFAIPFAFESSELDL